MKELIVKLTGYQIRLLEDLLDSLEGSEFGNKEERSVKSILGRLEDAK